MAISDLNGVLAGFQPGMYFFKGSTPTLVIGRPQSLWGLSGIPAGGSYNTTINGGTYSSTSALVAGQLYHVDPAGGINAYLGRWQVQTGGAGTHVMLCDRIWDNQVATSNTSLQTIASPTWPSRDAFGIANGDGIVAAIEISAATSATAAALTSYTYTNQSGVGSRTGNFIDAPTAVAASAGQFYRLSLQSPDTGIRSIDGITFSTAWTSGTVNIVAYRLLAILECGVSVQPNQLDAVTSGFPRLYNGVVPFLVLIPTATTAVGTQGFYVECQG